jgi:hypothetical protein
LINNEALGFMPEERVVRGPQLWEHQPGWELGTKVCITYVNCYLNVVIFDRPKMLKGLGQKARGMDGVFRSRSTQSMIPPAERQMLTHRVLKVELGKAVFLLHIEGQQTARFAYGEAG